MSREQPVSLRIENLGLAFGTHAVLKGIDLVVNPGELFAFLGPSGSGKSTLLRAIAGFGPQPTGRILIGDQDVTQLPPWSRNVGMVFQSYALWPHLSVRRNVAFGLQERRRPRAEIRRRVDQALERVGLLELAERRPSQLSGGQQRIALARTLVVEPRVLLLDEPLSNLDANLRVQMRRDILDLQRELGVTTIFVTHDQEEANTIADRMAVMDQGVIQQLGSPMALYDNPANLFVANFLGSANVLAGRFLTEAGETVFLSDADLRLPLGETVPSGKGHLVFRPKNLGIRPQKAVAPSGKLELSGVVRRREFLGGTVRYQVEMAGHLVLVDASHQRGDPLFATGAEVRLILDRTQLVVLPA